MSVADQHAQLPHKLASRVPKSSVVDSRSGRNVISNRAKWLTVVTLSLGVAVGGLLVSTPASAATAETMFATSAPTTTVEPDSSAVTVGVKFATKSAGSITAVRFYKGAGNTGTHVGAIYSSSGTLLAKATVTNETSTGWQSATLSSPIAAGAGVTYTAAVYMPIGHYAVTDPSSWPVKRTNLTGLVGTYSYGTGVRFPAQTYQKSNYFVDVSFLPKAVAATAPPTTAPPVTTTPPVPTAPVFPDASNTGVPSGTTLTNYTGPSTITTDGTVIDAKKVTACLVIRADNVTIKNSLIQSRGCYFNVLSDDGNTGLKLTDVEIDGLSNDGGDSAINGGGFTCLRCDIHGTIDGIKAQSDVVIKDTWIHDLVITSESHNDGIQSLGTTSLKVLHNSIVLQDGSTSAIILSTGSASDMRNVQIDGNLLGGGAYTVYGGYLAGTDSRAKVSQIAITNNRFSTRIHPKSGAYGPLTSTDSPVVVSGNTWYDGPNAGKTVS